MNTLRARLGSPLRLAAASIALLSSALALAHGDATQPATPGGHAMSKIEVTDFGQQGDPKKVTRTIDVAMADTMRFSPAQLGIARGETVRFVVHNAGKLPHEMVLGTTAALKQHAAMMKQFPEMEHEDTNMAHVKPGADGEIVWQFTKAGAFEFACLQPGHFEAGMVGRVVVR